ncbi:HdeD family acid-resistance protein [Legionella sp.]|uniref:HdeD family acid-resistance protein n=1 Tax=Legionella sp. TaxID=459 RepID=UPI003CB32030
MANTNNIVDIPGSENLQRNWGWLLGLGIVLLIMGTIGLGMDIALTIVSMYFFAALLMISGISHFADAFRYKQWKGAVWQIFVAILYLIATAIILYDPLLASTVITALLAWTLIILGTTRIAMAWSLKDNSSRWILFSGITSLLLGILILLHWPSSGLWVIGMFIAIDMIVSGWTYIFTAIALRSAK